MNVIDSTMKWSGFFRRVPYVDPGASAFDAVDGECPVVVTGADKVDSRKLGRVFEVTYTATDKSGNTATWVRRVKIVL